MRKPIKPIRRLTQNLGISLLGAGLANAQGHDANCECGAHGMLYQGKVMNAPTAPGGGATPPFVTLSEEVPAGTQFMANGMPILHSSPTSTAQVYLDFDGDANRNGDDGNPVAAVDFDGDPTTFNAYEQQYIYNWWLTASSIYSMFDVDVTTEVNLANPRSWNLISPSWNGGAAGFNSFGMTEGTSVIGTHFGPYATVIGHEGGHTFGLPHAINWDKYGALTEGYYGNPNRLRAAIMGSADNVQNKWYNKNHYGYDDVIFDDIGQVIKAIQSYVPASPGYRVDDHPGTTGSAVALTAAGSGFRGEGVIEKMSDVDMFSFVWAGGRLSLHTAPVEISPVCMKISLLDSNGNVVAHVDNQSNHQWLQSDLAAGTYYLKCESAGRYSDLGSYRVYLDTLPSDWSSQNVGNVRLARGNAYDSATGEWTLDVASQDTWGSSDSLMLTYQKLDGDGEIIARVKSQENVGSSWTKTGVMVRESLDADSKHMFALKSTGNGINAHYRSSTAGSSSNVGGSGSDTWVRIVRSGDSFSSYSSADGSSWSLITTQTIPMNQQVLIGLAHCSNNHNVASTVVFDNVSVTGSLVDENPTLNALSAPAGLAISSTASNSVDLSWSAVAGSTGYTIESSENGVAFKAAGTVAAGVTNFQASGLTDGRMHFFRVRANDGSGVSVASTVEQATTRPGPVLDLRLISLTTTTIVLDWEEPFGETGYRIERSLDGVEYSTVGSAVQHGRKFVDQGAFSGLRYYYRVVTLDGQGDAAIAEIRRAADPTIDDAGATGIMPWVTEVGYGSSAKLVQGSLAGNKTRTVDLSGISGDASYEFLIEAVEESQSSIQLLSGNGFAVKFEQWSNRGVFGATEFGNADWSFTAESGQSIASPYGALSHVVFVVDSAATETRVYVDSVHVGTLAQAINLGGGDGTLGDGGLRSDGATGIHAFAAYNSQLTTAEMSAHKDAWLTGATTNQAPVANNASFSIDENGSANAAVGTVNATDVDSGQTLSYAITAGNTGSRFAINSSTGAITTTESLNYEDTSSYSLTVTVTDNGSPVLNDTATITVNVNDVAEGGNGGVVDWEVAVDAGNLSVFKRTTALAGNASTTIDLSAISGDATYEFIIEAEEIGQNNVDILTGNNRGLKLEQWNNMNVLGATEFGNADWSFTAEAGQSVASPYGAVHQLVFVVDSTAAETRAYIDGVHVGTLAQVLDMASASATLGASNLRGDANPGIHAFAAYNSALDVSELLEHSNAWFNISNNTAPVATDATLAVVENSSVGTSVGTVVATDADAGNTLNYVISAGNSGGGFIIDSSTGEITTSAILDHEVTASYALTVTVTDDGTPALSDTAAVAVNVTNANEGPTANDVAGNVAENLAGGQAVATVTASDPDAGDSLGYAITAGNGSGLFAIDSNGNVTTTGTLDYESASQHVLTITVTDGGSLTDTATVTVNVTNANEAPVANDAAGSVAENGSPAAVATVTASDPDAGDSLSYTITAGNGSGLFAIDSNGNVTTTGALDFESASQHVLTVTVSDGSLTDTAQVTVNTTNVNETPIASDVAGNVDENGSAGAAVVTVPASDPDAGSPLSYTITAGNAEGLFAIDSSGNITATAALDFENVSQYALTVTVSDGALSNSSQVTINVNDMNEDPVFAADTMNRDDVLETRSYTGQTLAGSATDVDAATTLEFSKTAGPAWLMVASDGALSGTPSTSDLGANVFTVQVSDGNGGTDTATLNITVLEKRLTTSFASYWSSNEWSYAIDGDPATFAWASRTAQVDDHMTVEYGKPVGPGVVEILTGDPGNGGDSLASGVMETSNDGVTWTNVATFSAGTAQADLTEAVNFVRLRCTAAQGTWLKVREFVLPTNAAPVANDAVLSIVENSNTGSAVSSVTATDANAGDTLSYAITAGNDSNTFAIDASGNIITTAALDFEATAQYALTVTVTDDGTPALNDTATITVDVTNENEAPVATNNNGALAEDTVIGTTVATVSASDVDTGDSLSYAITAGNVGNAFAIDSSGQITTASALDYETLTNYNLTVTVTDSGSLTDTASVTINVTDVVEITAPVIATGASSNLSQTGADIAYSVTDEGGETPTVTLYYGETDGGNTPASWTNNVALGAKAAGAYVESLSGLSEGTQYFYTVHATNSAGEVWGSSSNFTTTADTSPKMVRTTVNSVSSTTWTSVDLGKTYNSAVIVATPIYADSTQVPVVTRLRNVSGSSFELKVDRADGLTDAVTVDVSVVAVEEGVYTQANDGVVMEAVKFTSTVTAENGNWVAENRSYLNSYTAPVVAGQVMSANDSNWSTFWSMGSSRLNPADASNLNVGKHVGEDANAVRSNETIGYIVIESGNGFINGVAYTAAVGSDIVRNYENSASGYSYSLTGLTSASAAALSSSGMDGADGAWPVLNGADALSGSAVKLIVDEDQIKDSEQKHATEQVSYLIFE